MTEYTWTEEHDNLVRQYMENPSDSIIESLYPAFMFVAKYKSVSHWKPVDSQIVLDCCHYMFQVLEKFRLEKRIFEERIFPLFCRIAKFYYHRYSKIFLRRNQHLVEIVDDINGEWVDEKPSNIANPLLQLEVNAKKLNDSKDFMYEAMRHIRRNVNHYFKNTQLANQILDFMEVGPPPGKDNSIAGPEYMSRHLYWHGNRKWDRRVMQFARKHMENISKQLRQEWIKNGELPDRLTMIKKEPYINPDPRRRKKTYKTRNV